MIVKDLLFLYSYLIYEQQNDQIFSALPQERTDILKKELKKFDRFPKEVRLTLVLKLFGYLVQHVRNSHLEMIHPTWIAESLRKEEPRTVSIILGQFSPDYRKQVLKLLGMPEELENIPLEAQAASEVVFHLFSGRFASMGPPWGDPEVSVETAYLVQESDLIVLFKQLGVREVARSFAIAGKDVLAALLSRIPSELQEEFLNGVRSGRQEDPEKLKLATKRLSKYDLAKMPLEEAMLRVGLSKIGSVLTRRADVARKIAQRISFELGMIILQADRDEPDVSDEEEEVISTMRQLISRQKILFSAPSGPQPIDKDVAG